MKKLLLPALACCVALSASAVKVDPGSRARLRAASAGFSTVVNPDGKRTAQRRTTPLNADALAGVFITLNPGFSADDLAAEGVVIDSSRGNTVMARIATSDIDRIEALDAVKSITAERPVATKLDRARALSGIDKIHAGSDLDQPYTGKNVLAGIVDGGFDPNHVNFQNADGSSRIQSFTYFRPLQSGGYNTETYGSDYIPNIDTESSETFHGTHTLGIMAGGYRGKVNTAVISDENSGRANIVEKDNPYYGVAYDADIAIASGASTDYYMALGIEEILNYAYYRGLYSDQPYPVVVNLSLGTNVGPHDGSSMMSQYMDLASATDEVPVIFCLAAGNEGDLPISLHKTLAEDDLDLKTGFESLDLLPDSYPGLVVGQAYVYSDTDEPFTIQAVVINKSRGREAMRIALDGRPEGAEKYFVTSSDYAQADTDEVSPQLAQYFEGYLGVGGMLDTSESGRYMAVVDVMLWNSPSNDGTYVTGLIATGKDGQRLDVYTTGDFFNLGALGLEEQGYADGMTDGSISDLATGHNIITVGAYNERDEWACMDGYVYSYQGLFNNNLISEFSSYGTLLDGRTMPLVCAPGSTVISSSNEYYLQDYNLGNEERQATLNANGRQYSWHQCAGTSMSTPVVAGAIALWLEANPYLTYKEVQDIIRTTSVVDADVLAGKPEQWGAGKLDAYAGIKEAIRLGAGVVAPVADKEQNILVSPVDGGYEIFAPGAAIDAHLYNVAGVAVAHVNSADDSARIQTTGLAKGIYILSVNGSFAKRLSIN